ncbi:DNA-binding FadR family transcriptional regulator [Nocardia kruczakiae]|uniref:DNA-binding FadR family transcriptional regulator n=1 Tax=Nocardia kruczakiae TaxID=261477 RepID=A0ABU1XIV2_9NOCA|nr:GntR family transcriptional regulator [Nocardia kruczakiae]MDR7170269.1 DNA-binding FadR family transcriptional regulator [Nocardia kruczakiae]
MAFQRIDRQTVPDAVFDQLVTEVLDGELPAGAALPAERQLAEALGVSRPTVREALRKLAHTGLIDVRQGGATTVRDFRRAAGLDLLPRLIVRNGEFDHTVVASILQARLVLGREVAALAAEHGGAQLHAELGDCLESLAAQQEPVAQQLEALTFWDHIVDGTGSIVFRLLFNTLREVYEPAIVALAGVMAAEVGSIDHYRRLTAAVAGGDPTAARAAADTLLRVAATQFDAVIRTMEGADDDR